ncbi:MAG TPA: hypothetical protein ENH30_01415 [Nitrospirae bacterium]|nr:hypothetical protein [Nitrospirota bacterium]
MDIQDTRFVVALSEEQAKGPCKLGQKEDCCIYLVMADTFECIKKHPGLAAQVEARRKAGEMVSQAIGEDPGCIWNAL